MSRLTYAWGEKHLFALSLLAALAFGCHMNKDAEGPMERAGKKLQGEDEAPAGEAKAPAEPEKK